jgi:hypothetical protein
LGAGDDLVVADGWSQSSGVNGRAGVIRLLSNVSEWRLRVDLARLTKGSPIDRYRRLPAVNRAIGECSELPHSCHSPYPPGSA